MRVRVFGPVVLLGLLAMLSGCGIMFRSMVNGNLAQKRADAVIEGLGPLHPTMICDRGDNGYGLDNQMPWYDAYFTADANQADSTVVTAARHAGWQLVEDAQALAVYPYMNADGSQSGGAPYQGDGPLVGVPYQPTSTYLADRRNHDRYLVVAVVRDGTVMPECGRQTGPPPGKVIIALLMIAESTAPEPVYPGTISPPAVSPSPPSAGTRS